MESKPIQDSKQNITEVSSGHLLIYECMNMAEIHHKTSLAKKLLYIQIYNYLRRTGQKSKRS